MYSKLDDNELIDLMKTDDSLAFTEIYNRYWKLLFSVAGNKSDNLADAEEIVQEVFFDLWKRRKTISIQLSLKSFLAAAVKFQVYSGLAKKHRESMRKSSPVSGFQPRNCVRWPGSEASIFISMELKPGATSSST